MNRPQANVHVNAGSPKPRRQQEPVRRAAGPNEQTILLDGGDDTTPSPTREGGGINMC